jgi:hypothetical protein
MSHASSYLASEQTWEVCSIIVPIFLRRGSKRPHTAKRLIQNWNPDLSFHSSTVEGIT